METVKVLAKVALQGVTEYVHTNWATKAYMQSDMDRLGTVELTVLRVKNVLSFSRYFVNYGPDLDLTSRKVNLAIKMISATDEIDNVVVYKESDYLNRAKEFRKQIGDAIDEAKGMLGASEPKSLDAALILANDVCDDFVSTTKSDLIVTFKTVCSIEDKSIDRSTGKFIDDYMRQRFGLAIRLFATLVEFVRENRVEITLNGSSKYPYMSTRMEKVIKALKNEIRLLGEISSSPKDPVHDLPGRARGIKDILRENGFEELAIQYSGVVESLENKSLSGEISSSIKMLPDEVLNPKVKQEEEDKSADESQTPAPTPATLKV